MARKRTSVLILGGGAAGLIAARTLADHDVAFELLEARDRFGGRVASSYPLEASIPVEFGPEFLHGVAPATIELCRRFRLPLVEMPENGAWTFGPEGLAPAQEWEVVDRVMGKAIEWADAHPGEDIAFGAWLAKESVAEKDATMVRSFVEGFHAADAKQMSVQALARLSKTAAELDESRAFRPVPSYGALFERVVKSLPADQLHLQARVRQVEWTDSSVRVSTDTDQWEANYAIITLPLGVLQSGSVKFSPPLGAKEQAIQQLRMGTVRKISFEFRELFWTTEAKVSPEHEDARKVMTFVLSQEKHFPTWWTAAPYFAPRLIAWSAGPRADAMEGLSEKELVDKALTDLSTIFGIPRTTIDAQLVGHWFHDWSADPFAGGAYSWAPVGASGAHAVLAAPLGALRFAGEATQSGGDNATVSGALDTGRRTALVLVSAPSNQQ